MKGIFNWAIVFSLVAMLVVFGCASTRTASEKEAGTTSMKSEATQQVKKPLQIPPNEAYKKAESGKALLVCAYSDETICETIHLKGAIFLDQLQAKLPTLPKDQEIIFYCA